MARELIGEDESTRANFGINICFWEVSMLGAERGFNGAQQGLRGSKCVQIAFSEHENANWFTALSTLRFRCC